MCGVNFWCAGALVAVLRGARAALKELLARGGWWGGGRGWEEVVGSCKNLSLNRWHKQFEFFGSARCLLYRSAASGVRSSLSLWFCVRDVCVCVCCAHLSVCFVS